MTPRLLSAQQWSCQCYNTTCCSDPWVKPLDIKGGTQKDPCFLLLLSAPVKMVCFGVFFLVVVSCAPPAHRPSCFVAPQRPLVELESIATCVYVCECVCVCVWSRIPASPKHILSVSLTLSHTHTACVRQNAKPSSNSGPFLDLQTSFSLLLL